MLEKEDQGSSIVNVFFICKAIEENVEYAQRKKEERKRTIESYPR